MRILPVLPVVVPLLMAAILAGLNHLIPRWLAFALAIATECACAVSCGLLLHVSLSQTIVYWFGGWRPRNGIALGISFAIDPLGAGLATLVTLLTIAALVYSAKLFDSAGTVFPALMVIFATAMTGFCLTGDLFNLFVFFELMSTAAFALCAYKSDERAPLQGALNFAVTNTIGATLIAIGIALVYARTGALNMAQAGVALAAKPADGLVIGALTLITCGFFVKAAAAPFHFWLADAHAVAPTPVCVLFSGAMVEIGLFGAMRVYWTVFSGAVHGDGLRWMLVAIGTLSALVGGMMCFGQRHLKRLLAFSTICHMGLLICACGLLDPDGLAGAAVYVVGHAWSKSALFMGAGLLLHRYGSVDEMKLRGVCRQTRWFAAIFVLGAAGLAGVPGSGIGMGGSMMHEAGWLKLLSIWVGAVTAGAVLRVTGRVFFGWGIADPESGGARDVAEKQETPTGHQETPVLMWLPALALACAGLVVETVPQVARVAAVGAHRFVDRASYSARVLSGTPLPGYRPDVPSTSEPITELLIFGGAILVAALALSPAGKSRAAQGGMKLLGGVRMFHSGHAGDYVAWLTLGVGVFGSVGLWLLR